MLLSGKHSYSLLEVMHLYSEGICKYICDRADLLGTEIILLMLGSFKVYNFKVSAFQAYPNKYTL